MRGLASNASMKKRIGGRNKIPPFVFRLIRILCGIRNLQSDSVKIKSRVNGAKFRVRVAFSRSFVAEKKAYGFYPNRVKIFHSTRRILVLVIHLSLSIWRDTVLFLLGKVFPFWNSDLPVLFW